MIDELPDQTRRDQARKGRGAVSNRSGRFEPYSRVAIDDGWSAAEDDDPPPLRTTLTVDTARSVVNRNQSPDIPFAASLNPYRGCEHGCIYCYARPSHAYLDLSPGLDFETRLFYKPDAPALLEKELRGKSWRPQIIALGSNTDPYQPVERGLGLTRQVLTVLADFANPVMIITKSALILRDLDILSAMAERRLVQVCISLTTLDRGLARKLEPRAASPQRRLETIGRLSDAGIPVTIMASPMIPALNDHELESLLLAGADMGAVAANTILLRLPREVADLFAEWAETHVPDRARRILSLLRQSRGGQLNDSDFSQRMTGDGPYARLLGQRFVKTCARLGLMTEPPALNAGLFRPPPRPGDQLSLFGG